METRDLPEDEIVWLTDERLFAHLIVRGAWFSIVRYTRAGIEFEVLIENDEYIFREDHAIESDDD